MAAQAAVLVEVPYFQKLLHQDWAKKTFGLNNKVEVKLPCDVSPEAVGHFLRHVYKDPQALKKVDPTAAPLLQVKHLVLTPTLVGAHFEQFLQTAWNSTTSRRTEKGEYRRSFDGMQGSGRREE
jgi:hypothetical protein